MTEEAGTAERRVLFCSSTMSNPDEFRGQELVLDEAKSALPTALRIGLAKLREHRAAEHERALWDLINTFGAAENEQQAKERLESILEDAERTHKLLVYLNDLTFEVHDSARPAYLRVAAESLSQKVGSELTRDAGLLLRRCSGREASMLKRIILESQDGLVSYKFKNSLSPQQLGVANRVISRLVDAGFASTLPIPPRQLNPGTPQWGCHLIDEDGRRAALERYASHLKDAL